MRQHLPNVAIFLVLAAALIAGTWYVEKTYFPKPEPKPVEPPPPPRETVQGLAGGVVGITSPARTWPMTSPPDVKAPEKPKEAPKPPVQPKATPPEPIELIALGDDSFFTKVLLTTRGGGVQQLTLTKFDEADRLGRDVKRKTGTPQPLRLIPGVMRKRSEHSLSDIRANPGIDSPPELAPGRVPADLLPHLSEPSYVILHYPAEDDPLREPRDADRMNDDYPSPELGTRTWQVVEKVQPTGGGEWRVAFETTLAAPYHLKLRKTYTLSPKDYHVGFAFDVTPLPGHVKGKGIFRYQVAGPRGLPVEGEWYTSTFRNVLTGKFTSRGGAVRDYQDAASINTKHGGEKVPRGEDTFAFAAVVTQYFASAVCIDDTQPANVRARMWDYVRPTREPLPGDPDQPFLGDVSVRAVSSPLDPESGEAVSHKYLIYDGPAKVRLLKLMDATGADRDVDNDLVDRYLDRLALKTITDYHSPNFFGRVANAIWWSDLVITFTNLMHNVLYLIHKVVGSWGLSIILLTICVRLMLMIPSRKQQVVMARQQEKMAKMKPELDKLQEKYKDNPQLLQQEKAKLMFQHGMNPVSTMGGCLLLVAQMPIFMGLYFCLQESVFFRLQDFLWVPNLAAPDMTVWWTEQIPYVAAPENLGGSIYLGPFLNVLPLLSTTLIFLQQRLTMPPPTDEMQEQQQKMMKFMIVFMAVFFYKVPAGLCLYFICSTSWALMERKLIPKPKAVLAAQAAQKTDRPAAASEPPANGTGGGLFARIKAKAEEMQRQVDEQSRRQIRNEPPPTQEPRDRKKKRKK